MPSKPGLLRGFILLKCLSTLWSSGHGVAHLALEDGREVLMPPVVCILCVREEVSTLAADLWDRTLPIDWRPCTRWRCLRRTMHQAIWTKKRLPPWSRSFSVLASVGLHARACFVAEALHMLNRVTVGRLLRRKNNCIRISSFCCDSLVHGIFARNVSSLTPGRVAHPWHDLYTKSLFPMFVQVFNATLLTSFTT